MGITTAVRGSSRKTKAFLQEVRVEMSKVTWPTWTELKAQTIVVIMAVLLISAFIGLVDLILSNMVKMLVTRFS